MTEKELDLARAECDLADGMARLESAERQYKAGAARAKAEYEFQVNKLKEDVDVARVALSRLNAAVKYHKEVSERKFD